MASGLAFRVVAGLAAAALAAVFLEHYGLAGRSSPLPQPRTPRSPHPAPGPGASNIFWGLQVTQRAPRLGRWWWGAWGFRAGTKRYETPAVSTGARPAPVPAQSLRWGRGGGGGGAWSPLGDRECYESLPFLPPETAAGSSRSVPPLPDSDLCSISAFGRYPTFT